MRKYDSTISVSLKILYNYRAVFSIFGTLLFFYLYNAHLVDQSLSNLSVILSKTTTAKSYNDLSGINYLLDNSIQREIEKDSINPSEIIPLTISKNIVDTSSEIDQLKDLEFNLQQFKQEKQKIRNPLLNMLDFVNSAFLKLIDSINPRFLINRLSQKERTLNVNLHFLNMAKEAMLKNNYKDAQGYYELFILKYPDYQGVNSAKIGLAETYKRLFEYDKAKALYIQIISSALTKEEAQAATQLFKQLKELNSTKNKIKKLNADINNPDLSPSQKQDIYYEINNLALKISDVDTIKNSYNKLLELNPSSELIQKAHYNLGWAYKLEGNINKSQEIFTQLADKSKGSNLSIDTKFQISDNYKRLGKYKEAVQISQDMTKDMKDDDLKNTILLETASTYLYNLKDPEAALKILKSISKSKNISKRLLDYIAAKNASITSSQRFLGEQLLLKGLYTEAMASFKLAAKENPLDAKIYANMAIAYSKLNNFDKASEFIRKAIEIKEDDAYIQAVAGYIYMRSQNYDSAISSFLKTIDLNKDYLEAYYNLGYIYLLQERYEEAIKTLEQVVRINPRYMEVYANLGYAYIKTNNLDKAILNCKKALDIDASFLSANYNLALAFEKKRMLAEAKEQYNKVLLLKPGLQDALDGLKRIEESNK